MKKGIFAGTPRTPGSLAIGVLIGVAGFIAACGKDIRVLTPVTWSNGPDTEGAPAAAPPAPAPAPAAEGSAAAAAAPAPAAAPAAGEAERILYMTYWEGSCGFFGCAKGNTKVKRCNLKADNSMVCVEEAEANKAFSTGD
jgi:pyruvate/2-oxoglutarate dehydrogenase complex dihydrolipoamide acyltransferase (E2) component